jgi:hypothetical protein
MGMQTGPSRANMWTKIFRGYTSDFLGEGDPPLYTSLKHCPVSLTPHFLCYTPEFEIAYRLGLLQWVFNTGFSIFVGEIRGVRMERYLMQVLSK